jgi:hypothetical protein
MPDSYFRLVRAPVQLSSIAELKIASGEDYVSLSGGDWKTWVLEAPALGLFVRKHTSHYLCVPEGFMTDFASIPFFARWWQRGDVGSQRVAAYFHDYMYSGTDKFTRREADAAFYQAMRHLDGDAGSFKRVVMWLALRFGGFWAYRSGQKAYKNNCRHRMLW